MTEWDGRERRGEDLRVAERLAVLENEHEAISTSLKTMSETLDGIKADLNKYKGFVGAISLLLSGLVFLWEVVKTHLHWS